MTRLYTDAELAEIAKPFEQHAIEALRRGDLSRTAELIAAMREAPTGLDALSGHTLARKAGKLRRDFGEDAARAALKRVGGKLMRTWVEQFRRGDERGAITDLIAVFREQSGGKLMPLAETDDEVILDLAPCGSGGRLERAGLPDKHPQAYGGWSDGVSSYCQMCKAWQAALNDGVGAETWTTEKGPNGFCRLRFAKRATRGLTLFNATERTTLTQTRVARAQAKLAAGDTNIESLLVGQRKDWMPWHDFGVVCLAAFYAVAVELGGPDYLDQMLAETYEPAFAAGSPRYAAMSDDELVREIAKTWNYHCADFTIAEDDDRFIFRLDPCGSGGRLFRGQMWRGMYHYGDELSPLMPEPHRINFNRSDAPIYCTHCAASNRSQLKGESSQTHTLFFVIDGHAQLKPGQPCRQFSYKKQAARADTEPRLFEQIGLPAPKRA